MVIWIISLWLFNIAMEAMEILLGLMSLTWRNVVGYDGIY
jgi:hypothetical protein